MLLHTLALSPFLFARFQETPPSVPSISPQTRLVYEQSPIVDLYFYIRACAAPERETAPPPGFEAAVELVAALDRDLDRFFLAWGPIEGALRGSQSATDLERAFADVPAELELRSGKSVALHERAQELARVLREVEPLFLERIWPQHRTAIGDARELLARGFDEKQAECLAFHLKSLAMSDPGLEIPVYLVAETPSPGAVTHRDDEGRGVCFVAVDGAEGSQLFETVLHEATHALDIAVDESVLGRLRDKLAQKGVTQRDRAYRDLPHTLMFVQSAESIRRTVDPEHHDYGDVSGYYSRVPEASQLVRPAWKEFLDGKASLEETLERIAEGAGL